MEKSKLSHTTAVAPLESSLVVPQMAFMSDLFMLFLFGNDSPFIFAG